MLVVAEQAAASTLVSMQLMAGAAPVV